LNRVVPLLLLLLVLIGCTGSNRSPIIVSPRPTEPTPTTTPQPQSPTPTIPTSTPAPEVSIVSTATPLALDPNITPTSPLGPTFTPAPPTITFTPAPTELGIEIEYFITNAELIAPGDNVTLFWQVRGAESITVYTINGQGERENPRPLRDEGQITLSTATDVTELAQFVLVAEVSGAAVEATVEVAVNCEGQWFFAGAVGGCPSAESSGGTFAQQRFQNGLMIWSSLTNEIFIFYEDNEAPQWQQVPDEFRDGDPERDDTLVPPAAGLVQPIRGFGRVWRDEPGVRDRLGWAVEAETAYSGTTQAGTDPEGEFIQYIQRREGDILQLLPDGTEWQLIIPETTTPEGE
jgi:hypothetical protein